MIELNRILSDGRWGDVAAFINANFEKVRVELLKLRHASILTFCKGYFSTESRFLEKYPTGKTGEYAFVGIPWPGTVYEWQDTAWVNTGVTPQLGEAVFVELLKRHIDNETIYWDAAGEVIKSHGGGGDTACTISVGINAADTGRCTVSATGSVLDTSVSSDGAVYTILASAGGTVSVQVVPADGYRVQTLNVDKVAQGALSEYTFENLDSDHTMYVWLEEDEVATTDYLERDDLPGTYYSTLQSALDAVKESYPGGLTRDVCISCVKKAVAKRTGDVFVATLTNFNKKTVYILTIDGSGNLTVDGNSQGGLHIEKSDNILLRNIDFVNCGNNAEYYAPEETCAVYCWGAPEDYARNIYIENCRVNGLNTNRDIKSWYSFVAKCTENLYITKSRWDGCMGITFKLTDCRLFSLINNYVKSDNSLGIIGHPALCTMSNGYALIAEDNEFTGDSAEYYFSISNVRQVDFRRNRFEGGRGRVMELSSKSGVDSLNIESNMFVSMLGAPAYGWVHEYFAFDCSLGLLNIVNNTVYMGGKDWQQHFIRAYSSHVGTANIYNNIISAPEASGTVKRGICLGEVDTLNSGYNLYQFPLKAEGYAKEAFFAANGKSYITLDQLTSSGLEAGTALPGLDVPVLESGTYSVTQSADTSWPADDSHAAAFDLNYKSQFAAGNSRGCVNLHGSVTDESADVNSGYSGVDLVEFLAFNSSSQYSTYAGNTLLLKHNTLDRNRFVRLTAAGAVHNYLSLGRYSLLDVLPVLDGQGEYVEDELYTINID